MGLPFVKLWNFGCKSNWYFIQHMQKAEGLITNDRKMYYHCIFFRTLNWRDVQQATIYSRLDPLNVQANRPIFGILNLLGVQVKQQLIKKEIIAVLTQ